MHFIKTPPERTFYNSNNIFGLVEVRIMEIISTVASVVLEKSRNKL